MELNPSINSFQKSIDQSLIFSMVIYPSSFSTLNGYLSHPVPEYQFKFFSQHLNVFGSLLIKMNPLLFDEINEEDNEINMIFQEDNLEQLKPKFVSRSLDLNHSDRKGIRLIEKCIFFGSKKCMNFLIDEKVSIDKHLVNNFKIGVMEYAALRGNKDIIDFCLEEGQEIQEITIILGLIGHQNEFVEWMIEKMKKKITSIMNKNYREKVETAAFGNVDNIEFNEKLLAAGKFVNATTNEKRIRFME